MLVLCISAPIIPALRVLTVLETAQNALWNYALNAKTIPGCVRPFLYPNKDVGCAACESVSFFLVPVYDRCQCRRGTLIGNLCTEITNCITALIGLDGNIICAFCNTTAGFKSAPENKVNCVCKEHYKSNGTYCLEICGDGSLMNDTKPNCDDGNNDSGDGCSSDCVI